MDRVWQGLNVAEKCQTLCICYGDGAIVCLRQPGSQFTRGKVNHQLIK